MFNCKVPSNCHSLASILYSDIGEDAKQDGKLITEELNQKSKKYNVFNPSRHNGYLLTLIGTMES